MRCRYLASCSHDGTARVWDFYQQIPVAVFRENTEEPMGGLTWYLSDEKKLYLITACDKGWLFIYREDHFKNNAGVLVPDQKHIRLKVSQNRGVSGAALAKCEIFAIAVNKQGFIAVNTEFGEIIIFDRVSTLDKHPNKRTPILFA